MPIAADGLQIVYREMICKRLVCIRLEPNYRRALATAETWRRCAGDGLVQVREVIYVYAGMERDETRSYITNKKPGHLGGEFWIKLVGFLSGPILGIVATQFPSIADSILGWLQPGLGSLR